MFRSAKRAALVAALALPLPFAWSHAASAQKPSPTPRRPMLPAGADTNDADAYLAFGTRTLRENAEMAGDAFYWAARLAPGLPDALYARRIAWMLAHPHQLVSYMETSKGSETAEVRRVDSLYYRAMTADPLFYRRHDALMFRTYVEESALASARRQGGSSADVNRLELSFYIDSWLKNAGPDFRAWQAYSDGRFDVAVPLYRDALKKAKKEERVGVHLDMGRTFALTGNADSSVAHFQAALADLRARESKKTVRWYDSKALLEQSIAQVHERAGNDSLAREAYGRALQEDLSYYPAHARLGAIALRHGDTTTALSELDLAVQVKGDDPLLRYQYAVALATSGHAGDALTHLLKAVDLEPYYAAPYYLLGRLHEVAEMKSDAVRHYTDFVARGAARDPLVADARARLTKLGTP